MEQCLWLLGSTSLPAAQSSHMWLISPPLPIYLSNSPSRCHHRLHQQVRAGGAVSNDELVRFASLFNDELTLDNLDRVQLVSMCQLLGIPPFGTDGFLRSRLRGHLDGLKQARPACMHAAVVVLVSSPSWGSPM